MPNASKNNRFLTCFRPVVDIDSMLESRAVADRTSSQRFTCIPVSYKHDTKNSPTKPTFSDQDMPQSSVVLLPHPPKRTFSKVIKAVVFQTVLNTRVRNKNLHGQTQNCIGSKSGYSTCDEKKAFVVTNVQEIKAPEWSPTVSSSNNSSVSESKNKSKSESTKEQVLKQKKFHCGGIYWILVSLAITAFWGKINVIILTSLLLCFLWVWNARWEKGVAKLRNAESKVNKNRRRDHSGRGGGNKERL
ncbi:uncharacterized protein LOC114916392 [Cajanus cajan]|uniref:Uncharacterized protein n=1 Tax=Cajanus cajan TaxID=3821 RepID=A0A151SVD3_CAJCA|nr:uncharacterized protein LOC114916392 [Cajanus cajan]KYP58764.1 hypothetical protein KK1_014186 [Cajanus cajan]